MLNTNATFDAYNALQRKKPVFIVRVYNASESAFLDQKFCTGTFNDIDANYVKVIKQVYFETIEFDPTRTDITPGTCTLKILDKTGSLLTIASSNQLHGRRFELLYGYQEMNVADFIRVNDYYIKNIKWEGKIAVVLAEDVTSYFEKFVLRHYGKTLATEELDPGEADIQVEEEAGFNLPVDTTDGYCAWGDSDLTVNRSHAALMIIGDEKKNWVRYHNLGANVIYVGPSIEINDLFKNNRQIIEQFYCTSFFYGSLILQILTTSSAGVGTNGDFDLAIDDWGLYILESMVDKIQIMNEMYERYCKWAESYATDVPFAIIRRNGLESSEKITAFEFFSELLGYLPAKFFFTANTKLGVKLADPFSDGEGIADISDDDLAGVPSLETSDAGMVNQIELTEWSQHADDCVEYETRVKAFVSGLIDDYGDKNIRKIKTYADDFPQDFQRKKILQRIFSTIGEPIVRLTLPLKFKWVGLQSGDLVNVTVSEIANVETGLFGITDKCFRVITNRVMFSEGRAICEAEMYSIDMGKKNPALSIVEYHDEDEIDTLEATSDAKKEMTEDATNTAALDAEDAFITLDGSEFATAVGVMVRLTLPEEALGVDDAYITIHIHVQDVAETDDHTVEKRIYYDETAAGEQLTDSYCLFDYPAHQPVRVKVDWTASSGTYPPTKVEVIGYKLWYFDSSITEEAM